MSGLVKIGNFCLSYFVFLKIKMRLLYPESEFGILTHSVAVNFVILDIQNDTK